MPSQLRVLLGRNVCKLRMLRGMTQEALAEKLGIDRTYLNRIESGRARPGPEIIIGLPLALGVSYDALFAGEPKELALWRQMAGREAYA